jgi:elongation factor Tu
MLIIGRQRGSKMFFRKRKEDAMQAELRQINADADRRASQFQHMSMSGSADSFRMTIEDVFTITGRGSVVTGKIELGRVCVGDTVYIESTPYVINGIEAFRRNIDSATVGDNVGILINAPRGQLRRGQVLTM